MTYGKLGSEFPDQCAHADLSDAAFRAHVEAIMYVYQVEDTRCWLPRRALRRAVSVENYELAAKELVAAGFWREHEGGYEIAHHGDVIRQSIGAQRYKREGDKQRKRAQRERQRVTRDVTSDPDRQTGSEGRTTPTGSTDGTHLRKVWPA